MTRSVAGTLFLLAALGISSAREPRVEPRLHALFGDGVVLQREIPCPVWGTAGPGDSITVSFVGQKKTAKAGADGRWSVKLDPLQAGGPHEMRVSGSKEITVRDVLVGEVWLAAGGTNMEMPLKDARIANTEPDEGPLASLRFFKVPRRDSEKPERDVEAAWRSSRSETVSDVTATGYFFGRELQKRLKVPVGVVQASADESLADMWISKQAIQSGNGLRRATILHGMQMANYEIAYQMYLGSVRKAEAAKAKGDPVPPLLPKPVKPDDTSGLYNGMIAPLIPFALRGAIFYQGEAEFYNASAYQALFPGLIQSWRREWGEGEFPFGYVQLANLGPFKEEPEDTGLARFRDVQTRALQVANTGMAVAIDIGEATDNRPKNKEEIGRRLALWAHARAYGKSELVYSGPLFDSMKVEVNKIRVKFKNSAGGLKMGGDKLKGFSIASDFRHFVWADAAIDGDTVVVWSEEVKWPVAVRYAWADNPEASLYNKEGLPAAPFRSDNW